MSTIVFSHVDGKYLLVATVFLLLLAAQSWLVNRERGWLGVFVPATYLGLLLFLGVTGRVSSLPDFVFAALGLLGLLAWWMSARETWRQKNEKRPELPAEQADPGDLSPPTSTRARRRSTLEAA